MNQHCPSCGYHESEGCQCQQMWWPKALQKKAYLELKLLPEKSNNLNADQITARFLLRVMAA